MFSMGIKNHGDHLTMKHNTKTPGQARPKANRPKVSFDVEDDMSSEKESDNGTSLPIVELKPFVQKVWRREKSLPSFYTKELGLPVNGRISTGGKSKDVDAESETKTEDTATTLTSPSPPPRTSHSLPTALPSQRMLQMQANSFIENKNPKEQPLSGLSIDSSFRPKSRIHPPADSKTLRYPEHSGSLIPGFITREDREKTTIDDISDGDFSYRSYSCSPKNLHPERHQNMKVKGQNVTRVLHPKLYNACQNSWRAGGSFQGVRHGSPASMLYFHRPGYERQTRRLEAQVYDHLDRKGVLPSLTVQSKSLKKRPVQNSDENMSEDYRDYRDAYDVQTRYHIGGIENSLKCLSEQGAPTKIERMLTHHLELNLNRFRSFKDYSPLETSPSELAKYYSTPSFNMTQGEVDLRKGLMSNTSKRKRGNLKELHHPLAPEFQKLQSRKAKIFEHLKSLENKLPDYAVFERNDSRGMSSFDKEQTDMNVTDDELLVPNDTPRTQVDSRISFKPTESAIEELSKETQTSSTDTSEADLPTIENEKNAKLVKETPRKDKMSQRLEMQQGATKSQMRVVNSLEFDKDGKTFITSDNRAHITVSG